jgi:riboflavin synthase
MFTGLVEDLGLVRHCHPKDAGMELVVASPLFADLSLGHSVAINGACLTVAGRHGADCAFQVGPETLRRTNLAELGPGDRVNLERALRLADRLGGHFVQGHVDGTGSIIERRLEGEWQTIWFRCPADLIAQMVAKGSVAVDGVSLTLVEVLEDCCSIALIPQTLQRTTLGFKVVGDRVNIETDILGKYVARLLRAAGHQQTLPAEPSDQS